MHACAQMWSGRSEYFSERIAEMKAKRHREVHVWDIPRFRVGLASTRSSSSSASASSSAACCCCAALCCCCVWSSPAAPSSNALTATASLTVLFSLMLSASACNRTSCCWSAATCAMCAAADLPVPVRFRLLAAAAAGDERRSMSHSTFSASRSLLCVHSHRGDLRMRDKKERKTIKQVQQNVKKKTRPNKWDMRLTHNTNKKTPCGREVRRTNNKYKNNNNTIKNKQKTQNKWKTKTK